MSNILQMLTKCFCGILLLMKKILFWLNCARAYSLPMSITAWLIPFTYGIFHGGDVIYGIIALVGVMSAHLGGNLFDDYLDYKRYLKKGKNIPLQKGKCLYLIENKTTERNVLYAVIIYFLIAISIGCLFIYLYKLPIIIIMAITGVMCLVYPRSSYYGFGELIIGSVFSPLLFCGVYYVMTGTFSTVLMLLSVPFAIMTITLLYIHSFMDFSYDRVDCKRTLCTLSKTKENAYNLLIFMIFTAYFYIFALVAIKLIPVAYIIVCITLYWALKLCKTVQQYIDKEPATEEEFMDVFAKAQSLPVIFALFLIFGCLLDYFQ